MNTTTKMNRDINRKCEMNEIHEMHLMDAEAEREEAFCKVEVSAHDLISVQDYSKRRTNGLSLPTVCKACKTVAGQWAKNRSLKLEADAREIRAGADKLEGMAADCLAKADGLRRRAEEAERDAARYRSSAERRNMEAVRLEAEADEYRRLADVLAKEIGLTGRCDG